jgi:hypothetical protein
MLIMGDLYNMIINGMTIKKADCILAHIDHKNLLFQILYLQKSNNNHIFIFVFNFNIITYQRIYFITCYLL